MEIQIATDQFEHALRRTQGVVEKKSTMPILSSALIEAKKTPEGGRLTVSAYDLEIGVSSDVPAEVIKEGTIAIPAKGLHDIVKMAPESVVTLRKEKNRVTVASGTSTFKVVCQDAAEFPALPKIEKTRFTPVESAVLLELLERTMFAVSTDNSRYNLNGVYFDPSADVVRMVATDGHRLALASHPLASDFGIKKGIIIPNKGAAELRRVLMEATATPGEFGLSESAAIFRRPDLVLFMRLIDGQFPDYTEVIPSSSERSIALPRARFVESLKRVSLISEGAVTFRLSENRLLLSAVDPDRGEAEEDLVIEYAGKPLKIGFNPKYVLDALAVIDSERVTLELSDELSPGVLRPEGSKDFTCVVMPMRVN